MCPNCHTDRYLYGLAVGQAEPVPYCSNCNTRVLEPPQPVRIAKVGCKEIYVKSY